MDDKELKLLIPSKYVRKHIKSVGWEFSDRERAAVMMNSDHSVNLKFDYLKNLCNNTTDKELKTQIDLWLNWVVKIYEKFVQNEDGKFVYDFYREGKELSGNMYYKYARHFNNWHDAYQNAMDMQWDFNFRITKSPISFTLEEEKNNGHYISFDFFENGEIKFIWDSNDVYPDDYGDYSEQFGDDFVDIPYPFERGDIVRDKRSGRLGVVITSQSDWEKVRQKKHRSLSDMAVKVAFVDKKGRDECGEVEFIYLKPHKLKDDTVGYLSKCSKIEERLMTLRFILRD